MSACNQNVAEIKKFIDSFNASDPQQTSRMYEIWSQTYDQDMESMAYTTPKVAADFLFENFSGNREEVQVLDVACGTGLVSKQMFQLGFRNFVGVDSSKEMLEQAAKTGLYQDLQLAILGPQPLPVQTDTFDVVILVGALDVGYAPVSVVRELCCASKPGGLVCMARGDHHSTGAAIKYKKDLERELQLMEEEGLWRLVGIHHLDKYMEDLTLDPKTKKDLQEKHYVTGNVYLYQKSTG